MPEALLVRVGSTSAPGAPAPPPFHVRWFVSDGNGVYVLEANTEVVEVEQTGTYRVETLRSGPTRGVTRATRLTVELADGYSHTLYDLGRRPCSYQFEFQ